MAIRLGTKSLNITIPKELVVVDIGNSRTKVLSQTKFHVFDNNQDLHKNIADVLRQEKTCYDLIYSSVNQLYEKQFLIALDLIKKFKVTNVAELLKNQSLINFEKITGMGYDRMLGLLGALAMNSPPLITIDCGTALTINFLDKNSVCQGGAIFAGAYTQMNALAKNTGQLPEIAFNELKEVPATNTKDAINLGVLYSLIGGIKEISKEFIKDYDNRLPVFITGGYSNLIFKELQKHFNIINQREHLVLEGILNLYDNYLA